MIKTDEFGRVTVNGMLVDLFAEYEVAGKAIARSVIAMGCDKTTLRSLLEFCFSRVMEVLEDEEQ